MVGSRAGGTKDKGPRFANAALQKIWRVWPRNGPGGGEEEDRTPDLRIANATLSQLSYPPTRWQKFSTGT